MKITTPKVLLLSMVGALILVALSEAQSPSDLPPGVSQENWIALSDSAGIVVVELAFPRGLIFDSSPGGTLPLPTTMGVLLVKHGDLWTKVDLVPPEPSVRQLH